MKRDNGGKDEREGERKIIGRKKRSKGKKKGRNKER